MAGDQQATLYVIPGSHPGMAARRMLEMKGIPYKRVDLMPVVARGALKALRFPSNTVPSLRLDGEKLSGSRNISRRLDQARPEPALFPADPEQRAKVEDAERWGDEVLQSVPRTLLWEAFTKRRSAMHGFQEGAKSPKLPKPVVIAASYAVLPIERRMNGVSDATVRADLAALPGLLDQVDAYIADGVLDGEQPNAADLQIAPTIRLLYAMDDVRPLIAGRPAEAFAFRWLDRPVATVPAGALPVQADVPAATLPAT
jgi:glutathione S-transferase